MYFAYLYFQSIKYCTSREHNRLQIKANYKTEDKYIVVILVPSIEIQYKISKYVHLYSLSQSPNEYFAIPATKIGIMNSFGKLDLFGIIKNNSVINIVKPIV